MISSCEIRRSSFSLHLPDHSPAFDTILHGLLLDTLPSLGFWDITRPTNFDGRPFSISPVVPFFFFSSFISSCWRFPGLSPCLYYRIYTQSLLISLSLTAFRTDTLTTPSVVQTYSLYSHKPHMIDNHCDTPEHVSHSHGKLTLSPARIPISPTGLLFL